MSSPIPAPTLRRLEKAARSAAKGAYAPYSEFQVGAAILAGSGKIYTGCNVENASYGLSNCAERSAIFTAAGAGERKLTAVVIYTPTPTAITPCGACRQVISEFGPDAVVISVCDSDQRIETDMPTIFGQPFGRENLLNPSHPKSGRKGRGTR
jgi:cytidine deaminase